MSTVVYVVETEDAGRTIYELWTSPNPRAGFSVEKCEPVEGKFFFLKDKALRRAQRYGDTIRFVSAEEIEDREGDAFAEDDESLWEGLTLDKSHLREYAPVFDGAIPGDLVNEIRALTDSGGRRFKIGITARPGNRKGAYAREGYEVMHVLRWHARHNVVHALEKRLVKHCHELGWAPENEYHTPKGRVAERYRRYNLYLVR